MGTQATAASGQVMGGKARAQALTPERRSEIASEAARRRWAEHAESRPGNMPKVLEGYANTLNLAGTKLPCAVISGPNGIQRVLSETGITQAILGGRSGASRRKTAALTVEGSFLPLFVAPEQLEPFISGEMRDGPLMPVDYLQGDRVIRGFDASVLVTVCKVWLKAREAGALQRQQLAKAQKAEILLTALAETGIVALIDEATGYEAMRPQNALQAYMELIVRKELAAWVKKFPDEFYENIYKLRNWTWGGMTKNRYSVVAHYTNDLVYSRLGPGILEELQAKTPMTEKGYRPNKLHQWLSDDMGDPMLKQHINAIMMLQRLALANGHSWKRFMLSVDQVMPKKGDTMQLALTDMDDED